MGCAWNEYGSRVAMFKFSPERSLSVSCSSTASGGDRRYRCRMETLEQSEFMGSVGMKNKWRRKGALPRTEGATETSNIYPIIVDPVKSDRNRTFKICSSCLVQLDLDIHYVQFMSRQTGHGHSICLLHV